jgi:hypothetical protein
MKMLVAIDVVHDKAGFAERLELRDDFGFCLSPHLLRKEKRRSEFDRVCREAAIPSDKVRDLGRRKHGTTVYERQMQADAQAWQFARAFHSVVARRCSGHQARGREYAVLMGSLDRFVHWQREPEIVSGYDEFLQGRATPVVRCISLICVGAP